MSMKVSLVESTRTREMLVYLNSSVLNSFASKGRLLAFILNDVFEESITVGEDYTNRCRIERKSKRHKKFVPLECTDDFKELLRSLRVKKHLKLIVYLKDEPVLPSENPLSEAIDQIKRISSELQKSELWELLKSLTSKIDSDIPVFAATISDSNKDSPEEKALHHHILCDSCHPHDDAEQIVGTRYKCMDCENFDLCEQCYRSKASIFGHVPSHVMLSIPEPVNHDNFRFLCSRKIRNDRCVDSTAPKINTPETACVAERNASIPLTPPSKNFDKAIRQSTYFEELLSLIPEDETDKFDVIRRLIESKYRDVSPRKDELAFGFSSTNGEIHLLIDNKSSMVLPQGEFLLKFQKEDILEHLLELEATSGILPGEVASFEVDFLDPAIFNGASVSFVHSNGAIALEGKCSPLSLSATYVKHLEVSLRVAAKEGSENANNAEVDLGITVVPKGKLLSQVAITNRGNSPFNTGHLVIKVVNCFESVVALVTVGSKHAIAPGRTAKFNVPINNTHFKFPFRVVVESANMNLSCGLSLKHLSGVLSTDKVQSVKEEQTIQQAEKNERDSVDLESTINNDNVVELEITAKDDFNTEVDSPAKEDEALELGIAPKLDIATKADNYITLVSSVQYEGSASEQNEEISIGLEGETKAEEVSFAVASSISTSEESLQSEVHQNSLILPSMPLKSLSSNFDTAEEEDDASDLSEREDYDVISIADATEIPSDYEVLSCTNSYEV